MFMLSKAAQESLKTDTVLKYGNMGDNNYTQ